MNWIRSLLVACVLMLTVPLSAQAATETIVGDSAATPPASPPSTPPRLLSIYVGDAGNLQAKRGTANEDFPGMFFGGRSAPAASFWHLKVKGAPANNVVFGPSDTPITGVSNVLAAGDWTPASPARVDTAMHVMYNTAGVNEKLFEVKQTVLYVAGQTRYRVIWEIRNTDPQNRTIPFVFGTSADLFIASDAGCGVFVEGANRFLGGTNKFAPFTTGGIEEATSSLLPGESTPTPIARWASYEEGDPFPVVRRLSSADAFLNTINPLFMDNGVGVSFDDRATTGLAPGQTARYEVIWHHSRPTLPACPTAAAAEVRAATEDTPPPPEPGTDGGATSGGAGSGAEPTSAGTGGSARDTTAPVLSALRLSPSAVRSSSTTDAAAKVRAGAKSAPKIVFRLSERANVVLRIVRRRGGRRVTVKKVTRPNLAVGSNAVRIGGKRLAPGGYVVYVRPVDVAGNAGAQQSAPFRVVGR